MQRGDGDERTGMRRHQAVKHGQSRQRGDADLHDRNGRPLRHEHDDRDEQHDADFEKKRQPDERGDAGDRPRQPRRGDAADDGIDEAIGGAAVGQQRPDHGTERDKEADAADGSAGPTVNESTVFDADMPHDPQRRGRISAKRMNAEARDQEDDGGDAEQGCHRKLTSPTVVAAWSVRNNVDIDRDNGRAMEESRATARQQLTWATTARR